MHQASAADLKRRVALQFERREAPLLSLVDLSGPSLKAAGMNADLVTGDDYGACQAWSAAIHRQWIQADGIRYPSRQNAGGACVALFDRRPVRRASALPMPNAELKRLCKAFRVVPMG